ncbi:MAG: orotate phosphoribosyltransferase [Melioribacteraceae bacterium]|nr:orotate phosphoribosyltransferase [Melioribacteraceae bacterium]
MISKDEVLNIFLNTNALLTGHFLLTSGRHSDKYFQCALVLQHPEYNILLAEQIVNQISELEIDTVISPAIGGICVGQEVARQLNKKFIFAERENGKMSLRRGFKIDEGEKLFVCEDVVTTGGSVFEVMELIKENNAITTGVGIIVDRSNKKANFGVPQFSTLELDVISYPPEDCPFCKENIPFVKPGSRKLK